MNIQRRTPRTDMAKQSIVLRMTDFYEELAREEGVPTDVLDMALTAFAELSVRVDFSGESVDFELARPTDMASEIRTKFVAYLDTAHMDIVQRARIEIARTDLPAADFSAPAPLPDEESAKKK
jgi:hypothetical protein